MFKYTVGAVVLMAVVLFSWYLQSQDVITIKAFLITTVITFVLSLLGLILLFLKYMKESTGEG